jgi:hypothetical protein
MDLYAYRLEYRNALKILHQQTQTDATQLEVTRIPVDLLKFIDDGRNPEIFMHQSVQSAREANEKSRARVEAFAEFEKLLQ